MAVLRWTFGLVLALALGLGNLPAHADALRVQGYGEGDYLRIGSIQAGTLKTLDVREGDPVTAGQTLFALDDVVELAQRDQAQSDLDQAEAVLANLNKGKRPDELKSIAERKAQAQAALRLSEATLARQSALAKRDFASQARLDEAQAAAARDRALVGELAAEYRTATLGARADEVAAQEALVATRRAQLAAAQKHVADLAPQAPQAGRIERVYYRPGEVVPLGRPVVSMLPPENVKLVFFVPEAQLAGLHVGQAITYSCDGCGTKAAVISFLATQAEYTPPVIYSIESRQKLVYRVEARGANAMPLDLHPGQPVDVTIEAGK